MPAGAFSCSRGIESSHVYSLNTGACLAVASSTMMNGCVNSTVADDVPRRDRDDGS